MPDLKATLEGAPTEPETVTPQVGEGSGEITDAVEEPSFVLDAFEQTEDMSEPDVIDDGEAPIETPRADAGADEAPTVPPVQPPVTPAQAAQPAEQVQPVTPAPQQAQEQPAVAPQVPAPQQVAGPDQNALNTLHQAIEGKRDEYIKATASSLEATFTEDDINEFHDKPQVALSKMGARLHHDIVSNVLGLVAAKIPEVVAGLISTQSEHKAKEDAFFAEYAHLQPKRSDPMFRQIAAMVRQMNPQADEPTFKRLLATMASTHFGINPGVAPAQPARQPQPRQTFQPAGGRQPAPMNPAARPAPGSPEYWGGLDEILQADDEGRLNGGASY